MSPTPKGNAQHVANSSNPFSHAVHPSTLSYGRKHKEAAAQPDLWCTDAFEDDFQGHLCSIGSNSKNDGEAPLFCSARFY